MSFISPTIMFMMAAVILIMTLSIALYRTFSQSSKDREVVRKLASSLAALSVEIGLEREKGDFFLDDDEQCLADLPQVITAIRNRIAGDTHHV